MTRSTLFKGLIETTEGIRPVEMDSISLTNVEEANRSTTQTMGFRFVYGRTDKGVVIEFIKAGRLAKRDLTFMQKLGVVEAVGNWAFAPKRFLIPEGEAPIALKIEFGKDTTQHLNRWAKALGFI